MTHEGVAVVKMSTEIIIANHDITIQIDPKGERIACLAQQRGAVKRVLSL